MKQGKLRIYFGYAAGVGKTYAMLADARGVMRDGVDVLAGYVEPHARPETAALLEGMTLLPNKKIIYKGVKLREFDLDAALERKPQLILVDELAHTNACGSRNKKRFQDVAELLHAGIDVYTTINVQHLESLNDVVEKITGIHVNERIPDEVFDQADQIELVDIEPADLLERLAKGKVYGKAQAERAVQNFFTEEKLVALREIALRRTADQVNQRAAAKQLDKNSAYSREHILVCISASPASPQVIRAAARLAAAFKADLTAFYMGNVDEGQEPEDRLRLRQNLRLAEQLGAKISVVYGDDLPAQIAEYAKVSRVSKVVIGKTAEKLPWRRKGIVDSLSRLAPNLDIYIIPNGGTLNNDKPIWKLIHLVRPHFSASDLAKTLAVLIIVTLLGLGFQHWNFNVSNIITIYLLGVLINALITKGRVFSVISSVLSVLCFNYFFTAPFYSFEAFNPSYPLTFVIMLAAGLITSSLIKRIQNQAKLSAEKSYRTEVLLQTNRELQQPDSESEVLDAVAEQLGKLLSRDIVVYPVENGALLDFRYFARPESLQTAATYAGFGEEGVAEWVLHNNKRAGATTNTLSASKFLYLSVRRKERIFAVIGISMAAEPELEAFDKSIVLAILGEAALALEKEFLREEQQTTELKMQQEQLRANLLRAISHDLRTPLTSISGNARLLMDSSENLSKEHQTELSAYIYDDAMWLINLVENLLSITKLDGDIDLKLSTNVMDEVVEEAVKHVDRHLSQHEFRLELSDEVLTARLDAPLMVQVLINIINNAVKYTPAGSEIVLRTSRSDSMIKVEILDNGPGVTDEEKDKIFDLFYTFYSMEASSADSKRGLGLGLSLCKSIISAHGGEIYARDNVPQGLIIGFTLPLVEVELTDGK
ncbi:MAG: sensor histidine kinase KdpD [Streptococcaceae bacterium]|jgi:two-component system sensor histidine kinase KdpD|nr:sensor histidine kinase KdpD [Streptococcaceae bacterium]